MQYKGIKWRYRSTNYYLGNMWRAGLVSRSGRLNPWKQPTISSSERDYWLGPRVRADVMEMIQIALYLKKCNPDSSAVQPVARRFTSAVIWDVGD
jgi:hypothetical protein